MATTLIPSSQPTIPHEPVKLGSQQPQDPMMAVGNGMLAMGKGIEALAKHSSGGGSVLLVAVVAAAVLWGAHEIFGGRAIQEQLDKQNDRIERLEDSQSEISDDIRTIKFNQASIAKAVGADLYEE